MVFAEAPLADFLAALALKVDRCGVKKDELQVSEKVASTLEYSLLNPVLDAPRRERRFVLLVIARKFLAEPGHGSVEVMKLQGVTSVELIIRLPFVGGSVAAGIREPMKNGEKNSSFDVEFIATSLEKLLDDMLAAGLAPEPFEDERRPDALRGDDRDLPFCVFGEEEGRLCKPSARDQEGINLAGLLQLIESSDGGDDPLFGSPVLPTVLDDLEVGARAGLLGSEEHGASVDRTP